eukprot:EG_transcript_2250
MDGSQQSIHSLLRLYRFHDPVLEAQWQMQAWHHYRKPALLHCYVTMLIATEGMCTYIGSLNLVGPSWTSVPFWLFLALLVLSMVLLLLCHFLPAVEERIVLFHTLYSFAVATLYALLMVAFSLAWTQYDRQHWGALLDALPLSEPVPEFRDSLMSTLAVGRTRDAFTTTMIYLFGHTIPICLAGLNVGSLLALLSTLVAILSGFVLLFFSLFDVTGVILDALIVVCMTFAFLTIAGLLERARRISWLAQTLLTQELHASQMADNILNHSLKNTLADVAANIEVFLAGAASANLLEDGIACLRRGIKCCKDRQLYRQLAAGEYTTVTTAVNLREIGQQLISGRQIDGVFCEGEVYLDIALCNLILDNALSNALRHGRPECPAVQFRIESRPSVLRAEPGYLDVCFIVANAANPCHPPLTPERAAALLNGQARPLSRSPGPGLSDHVGLAHCAMAAKAGGITLALGQEGDVVTFVACVTAELVDHNNGAEPPSAAQRQEMVRAFPSGLTFVCIDDSIAARRLLEFHIQKWCQPAAVHCYGVTEADIPLFLAAALAVADVVVLDQTLEYSVTHYGTDLVRQLVLSNFRGLICIRSGNDSSEDKVAYKRSGAHCSFGKDVLGSRMMEELKAAYVALQSRSPAPSPNPARLATGSLLDHRAALSPLSPPLWGGGPLPGSVTGRALRYQPPPPPELDLESCPSPRTPLRP